MFRISVIILRKHTTPLTLPLFYIEQGTMGNNTVKDATRTALDIIDPTGQILANTDNTVQITVY